MKTTIKNVSWNKDYVINYGKSSEVLVACGVVGTIDEFVKEFTKQFPDITIESIDEKPFDYVPLYDRLKAEETKRMLASAEQ